MCPPVAVPIVPESRVEVNRCDDAITAALVHIDMIERLEDFGRKEGWARGAAQGLSPGEIIAKELADELRALEA